MPRRPAHPDARQRRRTFLANHREVIAAMTSSRSPPSPSAHSTSDHVIVLNEKHLQRLLAGFASYYLNDRTHLSLKKDAPAMRAVESKPHPAAEIIALPRLGGLHHRYAWRRAA